MQRQQPELTSMSCGFGRIVSKQLSARKWELWVDGKKVFATSRGIHPLLDEVYRWLDRLFPNASN